MKRGISMIKFVLSEHSRHDKILCGLFFLFLSFFLIKYDL